jgi:hypothetical protein
MKQVFGMNKFNLASLATASALMLSATSANAQMAGHNVVLVHGLQSAVLYEGKQTDEQLTQSAVNYWDDYWLDKGDYRIDWDTNERVAGKTAERAYDVVMQLSDANACANGCIFVTHSTGDLVARYVFDNMDTWLAAAGKPALNVLASIDLAGAGGGSELADLAVDLQQNDSWYVSPFKAALSYFTGGSTTMPDNLGTMYDLQVTTARNIATTPNSIPRLRFAGGGDDAYMTSKAILNGTDDSVVALHSACGAINARGIDSCSTRVEMDGWVDAANGPDGLVYNNYPILQGENISHAGIMSFYGTTNAIDDELAYVRNSFSSNGLSVNFDTYVYDYKPWWYGFWASADQYQYVKGSGDKMVSEIIYETFNQ